MESGNFEAAHPNDKVDLVTGKYGKKVNFRYVLTAAPLEPLKISPQSKKIRKKKKNFTEEIKSFAFRKGVDLFGISSAERLKKILPSLNQEYGKDDLIVINDMDEGLHRRGYGPIIPFSIRERKIIKGPNDYLANAKSVIVIGLHYPDACIERAGKPPSEGVGFYSVYAQWGVLTELASIALDIVRYLENAGYRAVSTLDLTTISSKTLHPWGRIPDATSNRFAALCAGLGEIGWQGVVLTPEYGLRQRFISIITDALLKPDNLYQGPTLCDRCFDCVDACPIGALDKEKSVVLKIENKVFEFGKLDRLRCDWAKTYGLVGEAGPKYLGSQTNILPPEKITPNVLCEALRKMDPGQRRLLCILEKCLTNCPVRGNYEKKSR